MSKDPVGKLTEAMDKVDVSDSALPKAWMDEKDYPGGGFDRCLGDWPKDQEHYDSLDVPCVHIVEDLLGPRLLSHDVASPQVERVKAYSHELKTQYITMVRRVGSKSKTPSEVLDSTSVEIAAPVDETSTPNPTPGEKEQTHKEPSHTIIPLEPGASWQHQYAYVEIPKEEVAQYEAKGWEV